MPRLSVTLSAADFEVLRRYATTRRLPMSVALVSAAMPTIDAGDARVPMVSIVSSEPAPPSRTAVDDLPFP